MDITMMLASTYHVLVTRRAREGTLPGGARDGTKKFGPLKAAMGAILDLYADREVRLHPLLEILL